MITISPFEATYNSETWADQINVIDNDTGTAWDLTDILIEMEVRDQRGCRRLYGSTADGRLVVSGDGFEFDFPPEMMRNLCAGSYVVFIRLTDSATSYVEVWSAALPVLEGGYNG